MYDDLRIWAVIQARMGSKRLPGKTLMPLGGRPLLEHVVRRALSMTMVDHVVIATTWSPGDDPVAEFGGSMNEPRLSVFRGDPDDVLARYYHAIVDRPVDLVLRITADSPLFSRGHLARMVALVCAGGLDGADSHRHATGLTLGLGQEVYRRTVLEIAHEEATSADDREHVSLYVKRDPQRFRVAYPAPDPALCTDHRLTMDYPEDYEVLRRIFDDLAGGTDFIPARAALAYLDSHPETASLNANCAHNVVLHPTAALTRPLDTAS